MTVSIRASLIFSALGMAALTAAFATPPASKSAETAIARCDDCQAELPLIAAPFIEAAPETKRILPASVKKDACTYNEQACDEHRETTPPHTPASADPP